MTVLSVKGVLSPDIAELGLSFANVVLAGSDEEVEVALANLRRSIRNLSTHIDEQGGILENLEGVLEKSSGEGIRNLLDLLSVVEERNINMLEKLLNISEKTKVYVTRASVAHRDVFDALQDLLNSWRSGYIPLIRRARSSVIVFVFRRAQARGIPGAQLDAGFEERFLAASPEEADSWQETAYLLAVPESADRLLRSIGTPPQDKTDQIPGLIG